MKKVVVGLAVFLFALLVLGSVAVVAQSGRGNAGDEEKFEKRVKFTEDGVKKEIRVERENGKERIRVKTEDDKGDLYFELETELEVEGVDEQGRIKVKFKDGKREIKISSKKIMETVKEELGTDDVLLELNEEGEIEVEVEKEGKLFGIFKKKVKIKSRINPETGELISKGKPWWAFLVSGEDAFVPGTKTTLCHVPPGNPSDAHTITVGGKAYLAHLRNHAGDSLGACSGDIPPGNETDMNLTLAIVSPEETTYNVSLILVDIDSNGDFVSFTINNGSEEVYNGSVFRDFVNGTNVLDAFANNTDGEEATASVEFKVDLDAMNVTLPGNETDPGNETGNSTG